MKQAVGQDLDFDILECRVFYTQQQVMPLQDLVQQDAVEKAAEATAQQITGPIERPGNILRNRAEGC